MVPRLATTSALCRGLATARIFPSILNNVPLQYHVPLTYRTASSQSLQIPKELYTPGATLCGQSGRTYTIQEVLAERREPLLCVYRARYEPISIYH